MGIGGKKLGNMRNNLGESPKLSIIKNKFLINNNKKINKISIKNIYKNILYNIIRIKDGDWGLGIGVKNWGNIRNNLGESP